MGIQADIPKVQANREDVAPNPMASSVNGQRHFPVDVLKIDRAFVDDIAEGTEQSAVARAIIGLSDALHLTTVAEGIETAGQLRLLRALGCELGQGYYFSPPPLQAKAFEALLQRGIGWRPGVAVAA
jgi:EAL domain-containing protein (putative c-di-GMP-specific phosphodiesterase class I)